MSKDIKVWLVNEGENLPGDDNNPRLQRMGLLAYELEKLGVNIVWWQSTFNHYQKKFRCKEDKDIKITNSLDLKLIHSCGYKKNVSIKRVFHERITAKRFYGKAKKTDVPDIVVVAMPTIALTHYAVKYAKKHNIPVIVDLRDLNPDVFVSPFKGLIKAIVSICIQPLRHELGSSLKQSTALIGTTEPYLKWGLNYAKREQNNKDKVYFVSYPDNGVAKSLSPESRWARYEDYQGIICCFFGQFGQLVDFDTIIDAADKCQKEKLNVLFLLCGKGELLDYYRKVIADRKLNNVELPGWVNQTDIIDIGFLSDVALMAYKKNDNFDMQMPNKFSESLSLGLAILLQPTGVMQDVIQKNYCGLHYEDSDELFERLAFLSENRDKLEEMKKNSRRVFEEEFSVGSVYKEYGEHIIRIAEEYKR